jgi:hypothetical protein
VGPPSRRKVFGHQQRGSFVGVQRNLLRRHDVAGDEILFRHKTPAGQLATGRVQLDDIDADATTYPISLSSSVARAHLAFASETVFKKLLAPGMQHPSQPQHAGHGRLTIHQPCIDKASSAAGSKLRITVGSPDGERARRGITDSLQPSSYLQESRASSGFKVYRLSPVRSMTICVAMRSSLLPDEAK